MSWLDWLPGGPGLIAFALAPWLLWATGVRAVLTSSVPPGLYATSVLVGAPLRDEYVCVEANSADAPEGLRAGHEGFPTLLKRVGGLPGDRIDVTPDGVTVNGRVLPQSKPLTADSDGKVLPHALLPRTLGAHEVWLTSEHPRGFDSRYFGPVNTSVLSCVGKPVWIW